uniref:Repressor ROX1 n=1 Tax=Anthurium amnicola TaxID=1678845 RepID=A0A1D1YZV3_9ARAE
MATPNFSLDFLVDNLMNKIDRKMIFPPHLNDPVELLNTSFSRTNRPTRPPNGFLLCRKNVHNIAKEVGIVNMRVISKVSGMLWRSASLEEKEMYENLASEVSFVYTQRYNIETYNQSRIIPAYMPYNIPSRFNSYINFSPSSASTQTEYPLIPDFSIEPFPNGLGLNFENFNPECLFMYFNNLSQT